MKIKKLIEQHKKITRGVAIGICAVIVLAGYEHLMRTKLQTTAEIKSIEDATNTSATLQTDKGTLKIKTDGLFADEVVYNNKVQNNMDALMSNIMSVSYSKPMILWNKYPRLGRLVELSYISSESPVNQKSQCSYDDGELTVNVKVKKDLKLYVNKNYELMPKAEDGDVATIDYNSDEPIKIKVPEDKARVLMSEITDMRYDVNEGKPSEEPLEEPIK